MPPPNYVYIHKPSHSLSLREKGITDIDGEPSINDPQEYFDGLVHALQDEKVSLSLTGGYDSRTLFANLYKRIPLKIFFSTNLPIEQDIEAQAGQKVADAAGLPYTLYRTDKPEISEEFLRELIENQDGDCLQSIESETRIHNFRQKLINEGYTLQISGDGGVLHKDWEWMQDLPFYHKKHTDLKRFYWQRIAYECDSKSLGRELAELYRTQEQRFIDQMKPYVKSINTQSYDALYYDVSTVRPALYNVRRDGYIAYAPMDELETVKYSYHLPRGTRFFYNFLRRLTTNASPEVARIPTNYGTTASSETRYIVRDVFFQFLDYARKAGRMLGRKFFRRTFFVGRNSTIWSMEKDLRALPAAAEAVKWAVSKSWLSESANVNNLKYSQLLGVVYLYLMSREYAVN